LVKERELASDERVVSKEDDSIRRFPPVPPLT